MLRRLLADRTARRVLGGQTLSLLGDSSMWLACGIWVKELTGSSGAAGLTFLFFTAPAVLAPLAGMLADRLPRRRLLVGANLAGVAILFPLLAVRGPEHVWLVYAVMALYGCLNIVIAPAQSALLATVLPGELLPSANALLRTVRESLRLIAPLAGAGLYALLGGAAVALLDMATFLAAAGLLLAVRGPDPVPAAPARVAGFVRHWSGELAAGFRHLAGHPVLRRVVPAALVVTLVLGFGESTWFAVVERGLGRTPEFLGVLQAAQGAGAVVGGLGTAAAVRRFGEVRVAAAGFLGWAVGAAVAATAVLPAVLVARVSSGAGLTAMAIALVTLLQRSAPDQLQGRVYAAFEFATTVPQTVSIGLGAYLVGVLDFRVILLAEAAVVLLAALLLLQGGPGPRSGAGRGPAPGGDGGHDGGHDDRSRAAARGAPAATSSARP